MKKLHRVPLLLCCLFLFCAYFDRAPQFRFAWLSDTHIGSTNAVADLEASVRDINGMAGIEFVLLSGDVTEMGSDAELDQAKSILDGLEKPYHILPGNHDTKWSESGCTTFRQLFKKDRFEFSHGGFRFIGLHQGPIMKMGDGHFAPEDLRWLDSILSSLPDPDEPLIFVTHYPLDSSIDNWFSVLDRLKRHNTQAVLVGHGHGNRAPDFEGLPGIMGRSNLRASAPAGGYTIVDLQSGAMRFSQKNPGSAGETEWHRLELRRYDATGAATENPRPDFSVNRSHPNITPSWDVSTGHTIAATPALWKDRLIVGDAAGLVYCLALEDGKEHWRFATGSSVFATPAVADGKVVFGSTDKNIYCLDVKDGRPLWKVATGAAVVGGATIEKGVVYIGGGDRTFRAVSLVTGKVIWEFRGLGGFVETKPLVYRDKVIFGAWDTWLYALNAGDGTLAWKWSNGDRAILDLPPPAGPSVPAAKFLLRRRIDI